MAKGGDDGEPKEDMNHGLAGVALMFAIVIGVVVIYTMFNGAKSTKKEQPMPANQPQTVPMQMQAPASAMSRAETEMRVQSLFDLRRA